jgi:hypothetical protein
LQSGQVAFHLHSNKSLEASRCNGRSNEELGALAATRRQHVLQILELKGSTKKPVGLQLFGKKCVPPVFFVSGVFFSVNLGIPPISGQTHVFLCSTCYVQNVVLRRFECALNGTNQPEELGPLEPRKSTRLFLAEMG